MGPQDNPDDDYAEAAREIEAGTLDRGLWERLFHEADGDVQKTRARYIGHRVRQKRGIPASDASDQATNSEAAISGNDAASRHLHAQRIAQEQRFGSVDTFCNGVAKATKLSDPQSGYGYIDTNGRFLTEAKFSDLEIGPKYGVAFASIGNGWMETDYDKQQYGIIDRQGKFLVEPCADYAYRYSNIIYLTKKESIIIVFDPKTR